MQLYNRILDDPRFALSSTKKELERMPLGFVDVGARGGVHEIIDPLAGVCAVLGFEADKEKSSRLEKTAKASNKFAHFEMHPAIISGKSGHTQFYNLARSVNSSLLKPNLEIAERYKISGFKIESIDSVVTSSLDEILFKNRVNQKFWGELIKLDVQGAELDVLKGASQMLAERTVAALIEVEFCELYSGQSLFSEVEQFMRDKGFSFYGFCGMSYRSARLRDCLLKRNPYWKERLIHADAVFFKDFNYKNNQLSKREMHVLFACSLLLGYFDLSAEVLAYGLSEENGYEENMKLVLEMASQE